MNRSITMAVSSVTGNTAAIAEAARDELEAAGWHVEEAVRNHAPETETVALCFWCRKSSLDPASLRFLETCSGKRIVLLGTMGGYPDSPYADEVRRNATQAVAKHNTCLGIFLCQGKVRAERIEERRNLPPDNPHHLDEAGVARLTESLKHPDARDLSAARAFIRTVLD